MIPNFKKYGLTFLLCFIVLAGFWFRLTGIEKQLSYWNDESHAAIYARGIAQRGIPINPAGVNPGLYQIAFYYLTGISFKLLGVSEFAGRLPSVIAGTLFIVVIYFVTKKILGLKEALVASFLTAFSQMQLAWSTQLRPYAWLELFTLLVIYYCYRGINNKKKFIDTNILYAFIYTIAAVLFHGTGLMNFILIAIAIIIKSIYLKQYKYLLVLIPVSLLFVASIFLIFRTIWDVIFRFDFQLLHYRIFLIMNYKWLLIGASIGAYSIGRKNKLLSVFMILAVGAIFFMAIFKINSGYVRYSLPAFPLLYLLYGAGVVYLLQIIASFKQNRSNLLLVLASLLTLLYITVSPFKKEKIITITRYYYSINADVRENPIVDYKTAFGKIKTMIGSNKNVIVIDGWNDRMPWYMPEHDFIFFNRKGGGERDEQFKVRTYSTIEHLKSLQKRYKGGIVVVENWESQMSPEVQEFVRKNLKPQFTQETVKYNEKDSWSISVYTWGI